MLKTVVPRNNAVFSQESIGGVMQSPRVAHVEPAPACLCDAVTTKGSAMIDGPAQRLLSLICLVVGARSVVQTSSGVASGVLILLVKNNT